MSYLGSRYLDDDQVRWVPFTAVRLFPLGTQCMTWCNYMQFSWLCWMAMRTFTCYCRVVVCRVSSAEHCVCDKIVLFLVPVMSVKELSKFFNSGIVHERKCRVSFLILIVRVVYMHSTKWDRSSKNCVFSKPSSVCSLCCGLFPAGAGIEAVKWWDFQWWCRPKVSCTAEYRTAEETWWGTFQLQEETASIPRWTAEASTACPETTS